MARAATFAALCATLLLAACSSSRDSPYRAYFQLARQSFKQSFGDERVAREEAASVPYASMGIRVDDGSEAMLVLATDTRGDLLWTASSKVVILTRDGRVIRSVGLPRDIAAVTAKSGQALPPPAAALKGAVTSQRFADFPDISAYGVALNCTAAAAGTETITILGNAMSLARVDESCRSAELGWSFRDSYWLDPDSGQVWRSRQHVHPRGETVDLEILRPPG